MNCMKCGRKIQEEAVFCPYCLQDMEKYPIHPGAVVLLPRRRESTIIKKMPKRHIPNTEEQINVLRKRVMVLTIMLLICIAAIVLMFKPTMHYVLDEHVPIGQNYSTVTATIAPVTPPAAE